MGKILAVLYGVASYAFFFATFLYTIAFIENLPVPKTIDSGPAGPLAPSLLIDAALLGVFAVQHSVMARPAFKAWWTRIIPQQIERSTFVLVSTLALALIVWQWRPAPAVVWTVTGPAAMALTAVSYLGWVVLLTSTFLINHFDLFGLQQVYAYASGRAIPPAEFRTPLFYRVVRHPLYVGFLMGFWAAPVMSVGHLFFAVGSTAYILIGIQLEEHDLVSAFGDTYRSYQKRVSMILPWLPSSKA